MRRKIPFALKVLLGFALGMVVGLVAGERIAPLSLVGSTILGVIKGLAGPLLLFAILDAFLRTELRGRSAGRMVAISLTNALLALLIGLTISNILQPGRALTIGEATESAERMQGLEREVGPGREIDFLGDLLRTIPSSVVRPFLDNSVIGIVLIAVVSGLALRRVKAEQAARGREEYRVVEALVSSGFRAVEVLLGWAVALVPLAVFCAVAATVGKQGLEPLIGLGVYLGVGILGLAIHVLVVYQCWLIFVARMPLREFWRGAREAIVYAMGTGSSLATLPVTLRSLDRMGVPPQSARMAACVGTNLNNDGILLYEAMAVLFVSQAAGVSLSIGQQILAAAACAVAGIGISGIPEAGLISLLLVLRTVRVVPEETVVLVVPLLLTVDWILGRCRAMTNVTSDMLVAVLLAKAEHRDEIGPEKRKVSDGRPEMVEPW